MSSMQQGRFGYNYKHSKECAFQHHHCRRLQHSRPCRRLGCPPALVRATGQSPKDNTGSPSPLRRTERTAEESARKALKDMFSGKKDILAGLDPDTSGGGGTGGSGGNGKGHGGGGNWQPPNWQEWGESFGRKAGSGLRALLAICAFLAAFAAIPMVPQLLALSLGLVQSMLRLGGRAASLPQRAPVNAAALAGTEDLGKFEVSVLMKYGGHRDILDRETQLGTHDLPDIHADRQYISSKQEGD